MGLTKQLVCANITIVMEHTSLTSTREKLMQAGLAHFYQKGYRYAGLRQICAQGNAGFDGKIPGKQP